MSGLRLIEFSADDYRIADVLSRPHLEKLNDSQKISAALSLYFQWREHRRCFISVADNKEFVECDLAVDQDLVTPIEIVALVDKKLVDAVPDRARVRFEIFRTCYEFSSPITADLSDSTKSAFAFDIPSEVYVHKARTSPRYAVPLDNPLRRSKWIDPNGSEQEVEVIDLSVKVLHVAANNRILSDFGLIELDGHRFNAQLIRKSSVGHAVRIKFEHSGEFGKFFDRFIKVAYPELAPREHFKNENIYELYRDTGYLSSFNLGECEEEEEKRRELLVKYWNESQNETHQTKVDYVLKDHADKACGASGLARIFKKDGKAIWAFHQLCVRKESASLTGTGTLYNWRVEYLEGLGAPVEAVVWYKSSSKWLERIFTKLAVANARDTQLEAVHLIRLPRQKSTEALSDSLEVDGPRKFMNMPGVLVGSGPEFLNASRLFEMVWVTDQTTNQEELTHAREVYHRLAGDNEYDFYSISIPAKSDIKLEHETRPTDRCFRLNPAAFSDLISSVEHSIAVTKKKQAKT